MIFIYRILTILSYPILIILIYLRKLQKKEHKDRFQNCGSNQTLRLLHIFNGKSFTIDETIHVVQGVAKCRKSIEILILVHDVHTSGERNDHDKQNDSKCPNSFHDLDNHSNQRSKRRQRTHVIEHFHGQQR